MISPPPPPFSRQMKAPAPVFHAFSGTAFTDAHAMHGALWQAVANKNADVPADIEKALGKKLAYARKPTPNLPMVVVVLDEIDQLISSNRQVLRKLFEWADAPKSRLVSGFMAACPACSAWGFD